MKDLCLHHGFILIWEQLNDELPMHSSVRITEIIGEVLTCGLVHPQYEDREEMHTHHFQDYWDEIVGCHIDERYPRFIQLPQCPQRSAYRIAADYACKGRVLFCTDTGFMGLGPASIRVDDEACIMKGGKVPYILREQDDGHYNLVGECYISGAMHGELVSTYKFNPGKIAPKIIV
jgi:hypothetical protein